jgi:hypothetical protein
MNTNSAVARSNLNPQERKRILRILESNWQAEMRGRDTYATLAERETDLQRSKAFRALADAEQRHADLWTGRYIALGGMPLTYDGPKTGAVETSLYTSFYPNLSQYAANSAQTVQSVPNGVFSCQQLRGEPERNHPFAKPCASPELTALLKWTTYRCRIPSNCAASRSSSSPMGLRVCIQCKRSVSLCPKVPLPEERLSSKPTRHLGHPREDCPTEFSSL